MATATTEQLLAAFRVLEKRIARLEDETAFPADPRILEEGEFLKAQLSGVQGTEDPRPLFKELERIHATLKEMHRSTKALLEAINKNTAATNSILATADVSLGTSSEPSPPG